MTNIENISRVYLEHCRTKNLSSHTMKAYEMDMHCILRCLTQNGIRETTDISNNTLLQLIKYLYQTETAPTAYRKSFTARSFFFFLEDSGYVKISLFNPREVKLSNVNWACGHLKESPPSISISEVSKMIEHFQQKYEMADTENEIMENHRNLVILEMFCYSGIRISELLKLKREDVSFLQGMYTINIDGFKKRTICVTDSRAAGNLKSYCEIYDKQMLETGSLFFKRNGSPVSDAIVRRIIRRASREAGIDEEVTPKVLRYTLAKNFIKNTQDIIQLQEFLGDKCITTTKRYKSGKEYNNITMVNPQEIYNL